MITITYSEDVSTAIMGELPSTEDENGFHDATMLLVY
jgi:hypothetical protein